MFIFIASIPFLPEVVVSISTHKSLGVILFVLAVLRIIWRIKEGWIVSDKHSDLEEGLARLSHYILLSVTALMPLSGILMSVGNGRGLSVFGFVIFEEKSHSLPVLAELGSTFHFNSIYIISTIIVLHVLAAMKHQFLDDDKIISRILGR